MTLAENIALPLEQYTDLTPAEIRDIVALKLDLVGLGGFQNYYPAEISGGMKNAPVWPELWHWIRKSCSLTNRLPGWIRSVQKILTI